MSFRLPWVLWLLSLVPLLVALLVHGYRARREALERFGARETLLALVRHRAPRIRAARGVLLVFGVAFAILAWAGPQYGSRTRMLTKRGIDVVIALDFSKSMLAKDVQPSRIERAKAEMTTLLGELTGDRVSVIGFAGDTIAFPMTTDYAAIELFLRDLGPNDMPVGGTAIGRALTAAKRVFERNSDDADRESAPQDRRSRVVILMTDGEDHEGDPLAAADELASIGAKVFVVGIGSPTGEPIPTYAPDGTWTGYVRDDNGQPVLSALRPEAERQLEAIADKTGGAYFRAKRGSVGMDEIRMQMRSMKQAEHKTRKVTIAEDQYLLALIPAFLLLWLEAVLSDRTRLPARRKEAA